MKQLILIFLIFLTSCMDSNKPAIKVPVNPEYEHQLENHPGTKSYEIVRIGRAYDMSFDTVAHVGIIDYGTYCKVDNAGNILDSLPGENSPIQPNGLIIGSYIWEWVINGNKDPDSVNNYEMPAGDVYKEFDKLYHKAEKYIVDNRDIYIKINGKWLTLNPIITSALDTTKDALFSKYGNLGHYLESEAGQLKYPFKPSGTRLVALKDMALTLFADPDKIDTSLIREISYQSLYVEKENWGLTSHNYSSGRYYMEITMPGNEIIRFKLVSDMYPRISVYRIPRKYGGREDVLFVACGVDTTVDATAKSGGYVIRPRNLKAPEKRY